ncbi:MAG: hypothetical protein ACOCQ3_01775 [Natronomonas sp.]
MSCTDDRSRTVENGRNSLPRFDLECLYDDPVTPSELTIFAPAEDRLATEWMTVDRSVAIPIDRIR